MQKPAPRQLTVIDHPLVQHKLTLMRRRDTSSAQFRQLLREISHLLGYEVTRDLPLEPVQIETPLMPMQAMQLSGKKLCFVSIMRAGDGLLQGLLDLVPSARVGHVGLYRDHESLQAVKYYFKMPQALSERLCLVVDPMLATGNSAVAALDVLKEAGAKDIRFLCLVAAPEGVAALTSAHPDVPIFTAALDERLNEKGYILPGLGDAGDRLFGTK
ncbi:MAG: uracil phosphoribosyltransferase [Alphaproteobacteria bacterium]|nr:MAG: uracil phosphoribosyltransferase [Alphaproteobacteria bacterium]